MPHRLVIIDKAPATAVVYVRFTISDNVNRCWEPSWVMGYWQLSGTDLNVVDKEGGCWRRKLDDGKPATAEYNQKVVDHSPGRKVLKTGKVGPAPTVVRSFFSRLFLLRFCWFQKVDRSRCFIKSNGLGCIFTLRNKLHEHTNTLTV